MTDEPTAVAYDYEAVRALTGGSLAVAVLELIEDNIDR